MTARSITTDVAVLGAGPAGMAAVAAAVSAGASVVAVEAREHVGGNAVWSTGYLAFVESARQRAEGITDDEQVFVDDAKRIADQMAADYGIVWDEPLVRLFARESAETFQILTERGVEFSRFIPRPKQHSVDRMLATVDTWAFLRAFQPDFERVQVTAMLEHSARRLLTDTRRVTGVLVAPVTGGPAVEIIARNGVVLATGGFQANPALRLRYQPEFLAGSPYLGVETSRGDGHLMGQAVGGDLINMTCVTPLMTVSSSLVEDAIAVNENGVRFHDEAGPYAERVKALLAQDGRRGHYIIDSATAEQKADLIRQMPGARHSAGSLADLAAKIGCPPPDLEETVARWNAMLTNRGRDDDFGRVVMPAGRRTMSRAPFVAIEMVVGVNFSSGGFATTADMQVIDVFGSPIPGLYAAGDCAGALGPIADLGGTRISGAFTFGRLAGRAAGEGRSSDEARPGVFGCYLPHRLDDRPALVQLDGSPGR